MAVKIMNARWAGTCGTCRTRFAAGTSIAYAGKGRMWHEACGGTESASPLGKYAYTSSGARMTVSSQRCEDAPCCGCCD